MGNNQNNPTATFRFNLPTGSYRYEGRRIEFVLCEQKCILKHVDSGYISWKYEHGFNSEYTILGGYASQGADGAGPHKFDAIWIDSESLWMITAPFNRLPGHAPVP